MVLGLRLQAAMTPVIEKSVVPSAQGVRTLSIICVSVD
jgi:hypothetical protein